ncbi:insulinase family protein [Galbibacter sp.]|uniref:insulinase family protein n=1 Tax=Galbibacter sp. TaxID=2918471 RepID=UPI003A955546
MLEKSIRVGHLPNGFTYYLKPTNDTDEISLQFYVKVGRFNERLWDTHEYSHLMEHFGYIEGYLKSYYSENDATFKESGNTTFALTARMYTPYWSSVNSIDTISLKDRLEWFYNISNMDLKDSVVLREARCVRQETFYKGQGFELNRFFNKSIRDAAILFNSKGETPYTDWIKAYDMGGISVSSLREFYRHWYRPDRMGLVITGNIRDINNLEQQLIALYGKIPKVTAKNDDFDMRFFYLNSPPRFKTVERVELSRFSNWNKNRSQISLFFRVKEFHKVLDTKEKWINEQLYKAIYSMIYQRLRKKGMLSWSPKKGDVVDAVFPDRDYPYFRMPAIENKPGTERENLQRVASTLQQLWENGFTQQEWDEQKHWMLNGITSKDTSSTVYWEDQLKNHFVYGEILPAHKKAITKHWTNSLSLKDINSYLNKNFSVMPDDIYITASAGHPALDYTEDQVRGWIKEAIKTPVGLSETIDITTLIPVGEKNSPLMSPNEVKNLKVVQYRKKGIDPDTGLEVLELDNGVKLMLDWQELNGNVSESISISGTSPRGASCFPEDDYYTAISAAEIVKLSGAGSFNRNSIRNKLGREFRPSEEPVQLHIKSNTSTVSTRSKLEDLEKYLQLVYLYFTSPQQDSTAFAQWRSQIKDHYFGEIYGGVSPRIDMKNFIAKLLNFRDFAPSNQISTEQFYQKQNVKLEETMECYQTIFGNASDFTFVVKGRYEKERILPLLQKYLGNLPSDNNVNCSDMDDINKMDIELPKGPIYHTFYADKMKAGYKLYTVPYMLSYIVPIPEDNWKDRVTMDIIRIYLGPKFNQELRFIKGTSVYYNTVEGRYSKADALYSLTIFVDALDDELQWVRKEIKTMIIDLKDHGIAMDEKDIVLEDPLFFGRYMSTPKLKEKIMEYARSLTSEKIKEVATKYLNEIHQYEFVLKESKKDFVIP